jgi:uncharacterized protein
MGKILFFVILGLVIYFLLKKQLGNRQSSGDKPSSRPVAEDMVKCAHCGVNLPRSEAIFSKGEFFCTPEHHRLKQK